MIDAFGVEISKADDSVNLVPEEKALQDALLGVVAKHGKFNMDKTGVWAGYFSADENECADIGVICSNCTLYRGGKNCAIIALDVEPGGVCRFAVIPDGVVKKDD